MLSEALEHLVRGIVDNPDDVTVRDKQLRRGSILEVRVHPDDLGKVIGRGGRTATAFRTVVSALAGPGRRADRLRGCRPPALIRSAGDGGIEVVVGRIGRPHGLRGEVTVDVRTDEPERRFAVGTTLRAEPPRGSASRSPLADGGQHALAPGDAGSPGSRSCPTATPPRRPAASSCTPPSRRTSRRRTPRSSTTTSWSGWRRTTSTARTWATVTALTTGAPGPAHHPHARRPRGAGAVRDRARPRGRRRRRAGSWSRTDRVS